MDIFNKLLKQAATLAASLFLASSANAILITSTSDDFSVSWLYDINGTDSVSANAAFDTVTYSSTQIIFNVVLTNTTSLAGSLGNAGLNSFGFNVNPDPTSVSISGGSVFNSAGVEQNLPSIDNKIDVCTWAANNCQGGGQNNLLAAGASDSFTLTLNFSDTGDGVLFDLFGIKFQTSITSYEFTGCTSDDDCEPTEVTAPGTLALFGLGLLGLGAARRKMKNA